MSTGILDVLASLDTTNATTTTKQLQLLGQELKGINASIDSFFLITMGVIIYFMQCGFAFLEAGSVRSKNATNILMKNIVDSFVGGIGYYIIGYALAFGEPGNIFCGANYFALAGLPDGKLSHWFFHFVFAATASTIVSGAVAERCEFKSYAIYSFLITGFTYPVVSHWAWSPDGWLNKGLSVTTSPNVTITATYQDFAGSGVVHVVGGASAMIGSAILGPRINRFDPETGKPNVIRGHSVPLASLGGFVLFFGFFAFNSGSQGQITRPGDGDIVANAAVNTILSASIAACVTMGGTRVFSNHWSLLEVINGALTGMVAICAGCNTMYPWGACATGFFAALSYMLWAQLIVRMKIDDPLNAVAVHFGGGLWGVIAIAFLNKERGIVFKWDAQSGLDLAWQIVAVLAISAWSAVLSLLMFGAFRLLKVLRVQKEIEMKGLDIPKHGEPAYPLVSYGHGWNEGDGIVLAEIGNINAVQSLPETAINYEKFKDPTMNSLSRRAQGYRNNAMDE